MPTYTGISFPPRIGPTGGWVTSSDNDHIYEDLVTLIRTSVGERVMEVLYGSKALDSVFENMDPTLISVLRFKITDAITKWESRVSVGTISVSYDNNAKMVTVFVPYTILNLQISDTATVTVSMNAA